MKIPKKVAASYEWVITNKKNGKSATVPARPPFRPKNRFKGEKYA